VKQAEPIFFLLGSIYLPNLKKCYQTVWILEIFFIFGQFFFCWPRIGSIIPKTKNSSFVAFSIVGKHLLQKVSSNDLNFANFLYFWPILAGFFCPKKQKKTFYLVKKHLHAKLQKILSNSLDFGNFLHFWSILAVF